MFELVMWSFATALTPLAIGLLWRFISTGEDSISSAFSRPGEDPERTGYLRTSRSGLASSSSSGFITWCYPFRASK